MAKGIAVIGDGESIKGFGAVGLETFVCNVPEEAPQLLKTVTEGDSYADIYMTEELGPIAYGQGEGEVFLARDMGHVKDYSEETAAKIDKLILKIVKDAYSKAEAMLKDNMDKLSEVAEYLIKNEKMHADDFEKIMKGEVVADEDNGTEE